MKFVVNVGVVLFVSVMVEVLLVIVMTNMNHVQRYHQHLTLMDLGVGHLLFLDYA